MKRMKSAAALVLLLASSGLLAQGLNDTGIRPNQYSQSQTGNFTNDFGPDSFILNLSFPRQDPQLGRDAAQAAGALVKQGGGAAGFDFTRLCGNGDPEGMGTCPAGLTSANVGDGEGQWACTYDNVTGRTWEVKDSDGLRDTYWKYSWYNTDSTSNGGEAGAQTPLSSSFGCGDDLDNCNTDEYMAAVNALNAGAGLCGFTDWRLPTKQELRSIMDHGNQASAQFDLDYFPNAQTNLAEYWSATVFANDPGVAFTVRYDYGKDGGGSKSGEQSVRLVRGEP